MTNLKQSYHQLETILAEEASSLYASLTGHCPRLTDCKFIGPNELTLIFEDSMTPIECLFNHNQLAPLARQIRFHIDDIYHQQLKLAVERLIQRNVIDILAESKLHTNRKSIIFILEPLSSEVKPMPQAAQGS